MATPALSRGAGAFPVPNIWFNHGLSTVCDAVAMLGADPIPDLRILVSHQDPNAPALTLAHEGFAEPHGLRGAAYVEWCLSVCRDRRVDLFLPQGERVLIAGHLAAFAGIGTRVSLPGDAATLRLLHDKARFTEAARAAGLPMPWTAEVADGAGFDAALAHLSAAGLPACVKPAKGVFGAGFWRLSDDVGGFDALMAPDGHALPAAMMRAALVGAPERRLLVMEHLPGVEWSVDCLCRDGRLLAGVARRKMGRAQRLEVEGPVHDLARRAVAAFGLSGLVNAQFKAAGEEGSDPRMLEINARMSGGCLYTIHSGVNLVWWQVAIALGHARAQDVPAPRGGALVGAVGAGIALRAA
jgi:hypothetical protein